MTKKIFAQPEITVVRVHTNNIISTSGEGTLGFGGDLTTGTIEAGSADRFRDWE